MSEVATRKPSQFKSNYKAMRITARHGHKVYHPVTGSELRDQEVKELTADFAVHRGEYSVIDPTTGKEETFADIAGYFYDLDSDAEAKGWTDDEKEMMREHLIFKASELPDMCQIYEHPATLAPWPTYDSTHHNKIPVLAVELGLVGEALAYERENKNRDTVIAALLEKAALPPAVDETEELTAV